MFMNVKEEMLAGIADDDARYSDADAELCIKFMSLRCYL